MFEPVEGSADFPALEQKIGRFWNSANIYRKSLAARGDAERRGDKEDGRAEERVRERSGGRARAVFASRARGASLGTSGVWRGAGGRRRRHPIRERERAVSTEHI